MIYVERNAVPPEEISKALSKVIRGSGLTELDGARAYYNQVPPPTKAFAFVRYKAEEVCSHLDAIYNEKCAYCESIYRAVDARNIEHFRPKGGVSEAPHHPGYWWLASEWTNLLPCCPPCNQIRRHVVFDSGMSLDDFERIRLLPTKRLAGKGNAFPLDEPTTWVLSEAGDLASEQPLLIHPSLRNPDNHLEWVFDWDKAVSVWDADMITASLKPRLLNGVEDRFGKASIALYGLNRSGLARERMARIKLLQVASQNIIDVLTDIALSATGVGAPMDARLRRVRGNLMSFCDATAPYAAMARAYVLLFDRELSRIAQL